MLIQLNHRLAEQPTLILNWLIDHDSQFAICIISKILKKKLKMSEIQRESEIKKLIQDQVGLCNGSKPDQISCPS